MKSHSVIGGLPGRRTAWREGLMATLFLALLLSPNLLWWVLSWNFPVRAEDFRHRSGWIFSTGLLPSLFVLSFLVAAFGRKLWLLLLLLLPFLAVLPIELMQLWKYQTPSRLDTYATIMESNFREVVDFLGPALWALAAALAIALLFGIWTIVRVCRAQIGWTHRSRVWPILIFVGTLLCVPFFMGMRADNFLPSSPRFLADESWKEMVEQSYPFGVPLRIQRYVTQWRDMRRHVDEVHSFRFGARQTDPPKERQVFVLVIGEASRRDHWQLYGYGRDTTPELARMPNLVRIADLITPWSASRLSVPVMLTRKAPDDHEVFFHEASIITAYKEAGFETYWLSTQIPVGEYDSPISVHAYEADHVAFHNVATYTVPGVYDAALLAPLQAALDSPAQKLYIELHTLGSHTNYAFRYPAEFDRFSPSLKSVAVQDFRSLDQAREIENSYDNSILYTDYFLARVVDKLKAGGAIAALWYTSDHGEDLINSQCDLVGHGNSSIYNYIVPSVFWYSDAYAQNYPGPLQQLIAHREQRVSTQNIFESLIDMAGLNFPGHNPSWSLFSEQWQPHLRHVNSAFASDFDTATAPGKCKLLMPP